MSRIVVTGMGIISALGETLTDHHIALQKGICGINIHSAFASKYAGVLPFGEVELTNEALKAKLSAKDPGLTRTTLLALHAIQEAISCSKLSMRELRSSDTALISASTVGGMCLTDELYQDANSLSGGGSEYLTSYDVAASTIYLQTHYEIKGAVNTINTACSSSANAIMYGARLIRHGLAKRAIVGGTDSLAKFTINGFNALHILSHFPCKPFDKDRTGLNLGEGAAFLVLEKEEDCSNKPFYAALTGYANTNDAFHPSSLSENGEGPYLAMKNALASAGLSPSDIGFVNAHGTGTENNDEVESRAMLRLFRSVPDFASTKSNTGHTLGAAGAIEAVCSVLGLVHGEIYPGLNFEQAIAGTGLVPVRNHKKSALKHVMSNSFGFGGNCSSLIFSKV